jgi:hypothetical protein
MKNPVYVQIQARKVKARLRMLQHAQEPWPDLDGCIRQLIVIASRISVRQTVEAIRHWGGVRVLHTPGFRAHLTCGRVYGV